MKIFIENSFLFEKCTGMGQYTKTIMNTTHCLNLKFYSINFKYFLNLQWSNINFINL